MASADLRALLHCHDFQPVLPEVLLALSADQGRFRMLMNQPALGSGSRSEAFQKNLRPDLPLLVYPGFRPSEP